MHSQHISWTVQDVLTSSGIKKLFFNVPELHRINTQMSQRFCDPSRRCVSLQRNQEAVRQENTFTQERLPFINVTKHLTRVE